jgi:hypothetical protein
MSTEERYLISIFHLNSEPFGLSYDEWTIRWWRWLIAIPKSINPALDLNGDNCSQNQFDEEVWFVAGTAKPLTSVKRKCIIPSGRAILFPIVNNLVSFLEYPETKNENDLLSIVGKDFANGTEMQLQVDETSFPLIDICRVTSHPFEITYPVDNIFQAKPGISIAVSDGFWVFLHPLPNGKHSIFFYGHEPNYETEVHYVIEVR